VENPGIKIKEEPMPPAQSGPNSLGKAAIFVGLLFAWIAGGPLPAIAGESIILGPPRDFNAIGMPHTVVAIVTDDSGQRVAGRQVDFVIRSGPHAGLTGGSVTGTDGVALFTYTGTAAGIDEIVASFVDADGNRQTSNVVFKEWFQPRCGNGVLDPGEVCEPRMFCAGGCNFVLGFCFDIPCAGDCTCPCGNGVLDPGEECDDMNRTWEDGCSPGCRIERCPLGAGFWKNHADAWPVDDLRLGRETYSKDELLALLETPVGPGGEADASLVLANQLIAAQLNVGSGSAITSEVDPIIAGPAALFNLAGRFPYGVDPGSPIGTQLIDAAGVLERYNKGKFTPACEPRPR
jgi:cysteine-rich repeat protein